MRRCAVWVGLGLGVAGAACGAGEGRAPVARIVATPPAIPEHDDFRTEVALDGTASADPIDDPDGEAPLDHEWEIRGDEFRFVDGDEIDPAPTITLRGTTPATVRLTVTDESGLSNTATLRMQLTVTSAEPTE